MTVEIKNRFTGVVILTLDTPDGSLKGANLSRANLSRADLSRARMPTYSKWTVSHSIKDDEAQIHIGCKTKTPEEWLEWFTNSNETFSTERDTDDFKRIYALFLAHYHYLKALEIIK